MKQRSGKFWIAVLGGVLVLALLAPVALYVNVFGSYISHDRKMWSEMGTAMSGIYGPILTFLTISLLVHQLRLQRRTNEHMFNQAYLQDAKADIHFYLMEISSILEKQLPGGQTVRAVLHSGFANASLAQLNGVQLQQAAHSLHNDVPHLNAMWGAIGAHTISVGMAKEPIYQSHYLSAKMKIGAVLSNASCVALDNFRFCLAPHDDIKYQLQFSPNFPRLQS